jgi:hypothetical protein
MARSGFGHMWKQADLSGIEFMISVDVDASSGVSQACNAQPSSHKVLQQFPGHSLALSCSPYFMAQVSFWADYAVLQPLCMSCLAIPC